MNLLFVLLAYHVNLGILEIVIFLFAAILLGFSIHFYSAGRRSVPGIRTATGEEPNSISDDDMWRLHFYEQIEKHEKNTERLEKELLRVSETEKALLEELEEARDQIYRLERNAERVMMSETGTSKNMSHLVVAQQNIQESFSKEMTERLEKAYEEFNILQDRIDKIKQYLVDNPKTAEFEELEKKHDHLSRENDELKLKQFNLMDENHRLNRILTDTEDKLRDAAFQKDQLLRKVSFLEELNTDLQQMSAHNKKLEGQLRRIDELDSLLAGNASSR